MQILAEERKKIICEIVNRKKAVRVADLSKRLGITEATVRRDLYELQEEKKLRRTHGGAVALYPVATDYVISDLVSVNAAEKQRIAKLAYSHIDDFDAVMFDGSSTVLELAKLIATGDKKGIIILTNAISVVNALVSKKDVTVIHLGGEMRYHLNSTVGRMTERAIKEVRVDKTFIGINGVDHEYGYSITNFDEAAVKKEMIKSAKQSYVLADHTKFGSTYLAKVADPEGGIDILITDERLEDFDYALIEEKVELLFASEAEE